MRQCTHVPKGYVSNQPDGYDSTRPHASRSCCDRDKCIATAVQWVVLQTNEPAFFTAYKREQS